MISAIVLAAGESTRMGEQNKLLLPFGDTTLIGHMVATLAAYASEGQGDGGISDTDLGGGVLGGGVLGGGVLTEIVVVLGHQAQAVRHALEDQPERLVRLVENPNHAEGMGSTIKAGLAAASGKASGYMICLTDLPLLEKEDYANITRAFDPSSEQDIVVPYHGEERGNPVLFSARYREEVLTTRGPIAGCRGIVQRYPERVLPLQMESDRILWDIDTPEDYQRLMAKTC